MTQDLAVIKAEVGIFLPPDIVLENARTAARALTDVLAHKKKPVIMNGEQYLEYEDWQTVAQFYGYTVKTGDAIPVEIDGVKGAKAHADLIDIKTGLYLGGAEAYCMRDEEHWNTRPKYEWLGEGADRKRVKTGDDVVPWFQLASMAQTRAGAKAFRNRLAWVVVLAGYRPTPAEEMTEGTVSEAVKERRTVDKANHYCSVHDVNFFKKGRMRDYAHPIEGTDPPQWCQEVKPIHTVEQVAREMAKKPASPPASPAPSPEGTADKSSPPADNKDELAQAYQDYTSEPPASIVSVNVPTDIGFDMDWVKETLAIIKWKDSTALSWLKAQVKAEGNNLAEALSLLPAYKCKIFIDHISAMREASGQ